MSKSRMKNAVMNSVFGIISYVIIMLTTFISRKIFAYSLGAEYLGLNGLFSNIVSMLAITELGMGTAILCFLYKPIVEQDHKRITELMYYCKKIYIKIAIVITIIGGFLTIFINDIANTSINENDVRLYFILFFINTAVSYLWSYKQNILYANQENRLISIIHMISKIIVSIIQCTILLILNSFYLYIVVQIAGTILENLLISSYVNKKYQFLKETKYETLSKKDKKELFDTVKPLIIQNLSGFIVTSTDSLIISKFINVYSAGIYSNYILITSTLSTLFSQIFSAFTTSFGNLYSSESTKKCLEVFKRVNLLSYWLVVISITGFICISENFVTLWLGKEYVLSELTIILIAVSLYLTILNVPFISVQNALGLHKYDNIAMIFQGGANLVISIILVKYVGIVGVIMGTIISTALFPVISKPYVIYKYVFNISPINYYSTYFFRGILAIFVNIIAYNISKIIIFDSILLTIIVKGLIVLLISNTILILIYFRNNEFKYFNNIFIKIFKSNYNKNNK